MRLAYYANCHGPQGSQAVVRHGCLPEREVPTDIGAVRVKVSCMPDHSGTGIRFHSALLLPSIRRSTSLAALLPGCTCVRGLSLARQISRRGPGNHDIGIMRSEDKNTDGVSLERTL
jgi:hypothetical protein